MAYVTRTKPRRIVIESYSDEWTRKVRAMLNDRGYSFKEETFISGFWGTRFTIVPPIGRGSQAKINELVDFR